MNAPSPALQIPTPNRLVRRTDMGSIALVVLDRPQQQNTLSEAMLAELTETVASIGADDAIRVAVLAAEGPVFCAGHDLKEITERRRDPDGGSAYVKRLIDRCSALMQSIVRLPQPVVAAVEGVATAAGCQLVASCDLAVASGEARFATPGVNIGLFCSTPMVALTRNVAPKHAMEMLLTGEPISADEACRIGLVNRVVAAREVREQALALARVVASKSAMTVRVGKEAFYRQLDMNLSDAYRYANQVMIENMMARDAEEGISAFVEKRTPQWEDR